MLFRLRSAIPKDSPPSIGFATPSPVAASPPSPPSPSPLRTDDQLFRSSERWRQAYSHSASPFDHPKKGATSTRLFDYEVMEIGKEDDSGRISPFPFQDLQAIPSPLHDCTVELRHSTTFHGENKPVRSSSGSSSFFLSSGHQEDNEIEVVLAATGPARPARPATLPSLDLASPYRPPPSSTKDRPTTPLARRPSKALRKSQISFPSSSPLSARSLPLPLTPTPPRTLKLKKRFRSGRDGKHENGRAVEFWMATMGESLAVLGTRAVGCASAKTPTPSECGARLRQRSPLLHKGEGDRDGAILGRGAGLGRQAVSDRKKLAAERIGEGVERGGWV
ncbi:hypothetical protein P7C73_g1047, partial [Tremellales sp. Uapishka_1]